MFLSMLGLWALCVFYFSPRLFALLIGPEFILVKALLFVFILIQTGFWFYIFYHVVMVSVSYAIKPRMEAVSEPTTAPGVALLLTTCNDFQKSAAQTHLSQDHPNYRLFILDDSTDPEYQQEIDRFKADNPDKVTVIRRKDRNGFKAGNVNYGLAQIPREYGFFSVSDADTMLPPSYIKELLPYIQPSNIAFAQAHLMTNEVQSTDFASYFSINNNVHFDRYAVTRNTYGFVMWYGHGALMRRDIYDTLGGFPEIATEDLAYSMIAREKGFYGVYCEHVICYEEFPPTYMQYRLRNEKWVRGTTECLLKFYPSFLKSPDVSWFEKLDVLVSAGTLLAAFPFVLFLILGGVVLPVFYHHFQFAGVMFKMPIEYGRFSLGLVENIQSNLFWSWDLFVLLLGIIFAPLVPIFIDYWRKPKQILNYLNIYVFCFFSIQVVSALHFFVTLITKTAVFPVTGAKEQPVESVDTRVSASPWYLRSHSNLAGTFGMEIAVGILFLGICLKTQNIWFLPFITALFLSPFLFRWNLNSVYMRQAISLPLIAIIGIIYFIVQGLFRI